SPGAAPRPVLRRQPAEGLPRGWSARERTVQYAAPDGDGEKALTFCINSLQMKQPDARAMEFVRVAAGRVEVGEPDSPDRRVVELEEPIYMGTCDVTQAQYGEVMGENPSRFLGPDLPVQCVSPDEAEEFCRRLSQRDGVRYRLPSDSEWEYACRAGSTTQFWWGEHARDDTAWWGPHMGGRPRPVAQKLANRFGLFDIAGNVREWTRCEPKADSEGSMRRGYCLCGGPYYEGDWSLASHVRIDYPDRFDDHNQCGFRVVVDIE
ncbi:MAG: formylglycine-generating enzyme family protein, partial [Candidatus Brocadiia bacterium]